jgi:hypothetical protein
MIFRTLDERPGLVVNLWRLCRLRRDRQGLGRRLDGIERSTADEMRKRSDEVHREGHAEFPQVRSGPPQLAGATMVPVLARW